MIHTKWLLESIKMFQRIPNGMEKHYGFNGKCKIPAVYGYIHAYGWESQQLR